MPRKLGDEYAPVHYGHDQVDIEDRLAVLRENETASCYKCSDYLSSANRRAKGFASEVKTWRQWYIKWMYNVADHFRLGRDVVSYAVAYIDKYASEDRSIMSSKDDFTVLAMTSLYVAVKVYSTTENASTISAGNLVLLTEGKFVEEDILHMEKRMLTTLRWKLYPPTSVCFLREYIRLLPFDVPVASDLSELSKFIIEVSATKYSYLKYPPSVKAYASLSIALECLPQTRRFANKLQKHDPFRYLKGLVDAWYPTIFSELKQTLADRQPYQDLLAKLIGKAHRKRVKSQTGVDTTELFHSPRDVIPWWDSMLLDL